MRLTAAEIAAAVKGKLLCGSADTMIENISTASGTMKGADLFVPIIGARVDAHRFIGDAFAHGAAATLSSEGLPEQAAGSGWPVIGVEDTMQALQDLGAYYRSRYVRIPYIGVTGSVGKTTTREMIAATLSKGLRTYSTKGNANSQSGVPITVTETDPDAEIGVIEMGISEFGEMHRISRVVQCDMAVVTVIGISHIANLGSQENIMKEKLHILDGMKDGGILLLNGDDPLLREITPDRLHGWGIACDRNIRILFYGTGENAAIRAENIREEDGCPVFDLVVAGDLLSPGTGGKDTVSDTTDGGNAVYLMRLSVPGMHMVLNSLAAFAAAVLNGVDPRSAIRGLQGFESLSGRGRITEKNGIKVINDAYNAAPQSMTAGLRVLDAMPASGRHIAVLADMLELGPEEARYHREVGETIARELKHLDEVWLYGDLARHIGEGIENAADPGEKTCLIRHYTDRGTLQEDLRQHLKAGDAVLFKGSNSMKLSAVAEDLIT